MRKNAKNPPRGASPAKKEDLKVSGRPWQIQLAKARFSELFRLARTEGHNVSLDKVGMPWC